MKQFHSYPQEGALERGSTCVLRKAKRGYAWTHTLQHVGSEVDDMFK